MPRLLCQNIQCAIISVYLNRLLRRRQVGREQEIGNREQGTGNREQRKADIPGPGCCCGAGIFSVSCSLLPVPCSCFLQKGKIDKSLTGGTTNPVTLDNTREELSVRLE